MPQISTIPDLHNHLTRLRKEHMELWCTTTDGQSLCALISGEIGWLMYLRETEDAGFSTRNPDYAGPNDARTEYILDNGQRDFYPTAWALPLNEIQKAFEHFISDAEPAPWVVWHNDSGDGVIIGRHIKFE